MNDVKNKFMIKSKQNKKEFLKRAFINRKVIFIQTYEGGVNQIVAKWVAPKGHRCIL